MQINTYLADKDLYIHIYWLHKLLDILLDKLNMSSSCNNEEDLVNLQYRSSWICHHLQVVDIF